MACEAAIPENAAKSFFDRLVATQGTDGCVLDDLTTEKTKMTVVWKKEGTALPVAEVTGAHCAVGDAFVGPALAMHVPEPLRAACPATVQAAIAIVRQESFDVRPGRPPEGGSWRPFALGSGAVVVATVFFAVVMVLRHRPISGGPRPR